MKPQAHTEQPDAPTPVTGVANEPSPLFMVLIWIPVFAVITWGMMLMFGRRPWDFSPDRPLGLPEDPLESGREPDPVDPDPRESA